MQDYQRDVRLVSNFNCQLTMAEVNEFHEFIRHDTTTRYQLDARYQACVYCGNQDGAAALVPEIIAEDLRLYELAKTWYAGLVARLPEDDYRKGKE